ncbi:MAG: hypothetical protein E7045_10845 [Lentisphaerae bacterium]|nr:hypothetical protein [Lentisphaerota bacterium]
MGKLKYNTTALLCGVIAAVITLAALRNFWLEKQITVSFSHTNSNRFQLKFTPLDKRGYKLLNGGVEFELPETQGKALKKTVTIPSDDLHAIHVDFKGSSGTLDIDNFSVSSGKKTISSGVVIFGENGVKTKINSADWNLKISDPAKAELSLKIPGKAKPRTVICWFALANILLLSAAAGYLAAKQFSRKVSDKFTIVFAAEAVFIVFCLVLLILPVTGIDSDTVTRGENRKLNTAPELFRNRRLNPDFFKEFDRWYCDRFMGRSNGIDLYQKLFRPTGKAFAGKNGWYFSNIYGAADAACNKTLYSEQELSDIKSNLENLQNFLSEKNCKLYLVLVPSKARVYREFFPDKYPLLNKRSKYEQLSEFLSKHTDIKTVDPLQEMLSKKSSSADLYHKFGTHWTPYGAYITYCKLRETIQKDFPAGGNALAEKELVMTPGFPAETELLMQLDIDPAKHCAPSELNYPAWKPRELNLSARPHTFLHLYNYFSRRTVPANSAAAKRIAAMPRGFFYGDSFLDALLTCESQHYSEAVFSTIAHAGDYRLRLAGDEFARLKPQVFVLLTNELGLDRLLKLDLPEE